MFQKNWHEFKNKLIVNVNDMVITKDGKTREVAFIHMDTDLKVFFTFLEGKKMTAETLFNYLSNKTYIHKSSRGFFKDLFTARLPMYQNADEVRAFLHDKMKREQPEVYENFKNTMDDIKNG